MGSPCRSCGVRAAWRRGVCHLCTEAIQRGAVEDVREPPIHPTRVNRAIRHPDAVRARIADTLARYPHLKRSS